MTRNRHDAIARTLRALPSAKIASILNYELVDDLSASMREHAKRCHDCRARIVQALLALAREIHDSAK